uniref:Putative capsid protein n=1 Tax=viral metagenome TaxID=1070528 RepID=A0A6M3IJI1_9ZZZZ
MNISTVPSITIRDYTKNQDLVIERPESPNVTLLIDKAKYFNFICDDIDKYQTHLPLMDSWSTDAGQQMKITIETAVFADIYADAHTNNAGNSAGRISGDIALGTTGTAVALTKANVLEKIVDCRTVLSEQNAPESDRWGIIPEWMAGMIMKSDLKDASLTGDATSVMRNGRIGKIADITLYESNLVYNVSDTYTCYHSLFGQKKALTFAAQMTKMESLRTSRTFGDLVRGLNVYGYEVLKTEALIDLYIRKG